MAILDGIVTWIAEQIMNFLDLISSAMLGALGCNMDTFLQFFPAAETLYDVFLALAVGMILLNLVWQLFKSFGIIAGVEAEDPLKLTIKSVIFIFLAFYAKDIVNMLLELGGTPYHWMVSKELPPISFANFMSVLVVIVGVLANGSVALIALILVIILAWNYIQLMFNVAERYVMLGILVFKAPMAFSMGASQAMSNVFKSWCRMFGSQMFMLVLNAWSFRLFNNMFGNFIANPLFW